MHIEKDLSYDEYSTLVMLAAINHGTKFQIKTRRPSRKVYYHEHTDLSNSDNDK